MKLRTTTGEWTDYMPGGIAHYPFQPLINILIRTHRPKQLERCMESVLRSGYEHYNVIFHRTIEPVKPYEYNLFCNDLKSQVEDGWFFFLDDDDELIPGALTSISKHLTDPRFAVVCQFLRGSRPKPSSDYIDQRLVVRGKIGMPCIFLHAKQKNIAQFINTEDADYRFIKEVSEKLPTKFVKIPVVKSEKRNYGR